MGIPVPFDDLPTGYASSARDSGPVPLNDIPLKYRASAATAPDPSEGRLPFSPFGFDTGLTMPQGLSRFMAGAGKSVVDVGRGLGQIGRSVVPASVADSIGLPTTADIDNAKKLDAPLMNTGAGTLGYVGGNLATTLIPFGLAANGAKAVGLARTAGLADAMLNPSTYKAAAAAGALQGAIQPVGTGDSRSFNAAAGAAGGVLGNSVVNGIGRVAQPIQNALSDGATKAADTLRAAGVPLDAWQQSGSTFLGKVRSSFSDNPFTAGAQREYQNTQKAAYNRAVLSTIGEKADAATPDVMGGAERRINGTFGDILNRNTIGINNDVIDNLAIAQARAVEEGKGGVANIINRFVDGADTNGNISGQVAYGIKKDLDRMASSQDTTQNYHARQVRSIVMDAINDSLTGADQAAFQGARGQFRNMKLIEGAISKDGAGDISAARLANIFGQKANRGQSVYGKGDQTLVDLAQAGKQLLPDQTANSGTTSRMWMQAGLPVMAGVGHGIYNGLQDGDWGGAALDGAGTAASVAALPRLAQSAMNNPAVARYLSGGMAPGMARTLLTAPEEYGLLGGALQRLPASSFEGFLTSK